MHNGHDKQSSAARRKQNVRRILHHYKQMQGCADCGTTEGDLVFDHVDPATKLFVVSQGVHRSLESLEAEIKKCQVRCVPCQRARHARLRQTVTVI